MMKNELLGKKAMTPREVEAVYSIPMGSLANMRHLRMGPKYFKAGPKRVLYRVTDVEDWISQRPVLTMDSLPEECR